MKKSLIALAVAAALPVAAQADVTLSGDVSVEYTLGSNLAPTTEASLSASASEVLSNGMTATASLNVLGSDAQGNVSLAGDFGTVKGGTAVETLEDSNEDDQDLNGISYSGSFAGVSVSAAAGSWLADGTNAADYTKYSASYDLNGLVIGGSNEDGDTELTVSYSFGDLTVSAARTDSTTVTAAYAATMGDLAVSVEANSDSEWDLTATYTMGDISITAEDSEAAGGADISAAYASGALSVAIDADNEVTVGYDIGNADLELVTNSTETTVSYTVAF
jgi:hypothetical protein